MYCKLKANAKQVQFQHLWRSIRPCNELASQEWGITETRDKLLALIVWQMQSSAGLLLMTV